MSERYQLFLSRSAEKDLRGLPKSDRQRVGAAIRALADNPRPRGCQKLVGREGYRIRVGVYRVTYDVDDDAKGSKGLPYFVSEGRLPLLR